MPVRARLAGMTAIFVAVIAVGNFWEVVQALIYRLYLYTRSGTPDMVVNATGMRLPDIAQSVREAQNLDWSLVVRDWAGTGSLLGWA
jgi:dolichyl-diphosphooligosaccharide--protein glycosyltransferase